METGDTFRRVVRSFSGVGKTEVTVARVEERERERETLRRLPRETLKGD